MSAPLTICCFKWKPPAGYRSAFGAEQVDVLRRMVARHYPDPHRFVLITDDPRGITEPDVEIYELWQDFGTVRNPSGTKNPSCYRRLRLFAQNTGDWLGERFVCLDLDCVITGDMRPLWNRTEDFVIWKSTTSVNPYNGSMWMLKAGAKPEVWEDFDPIRSPLLTKSRGYYGSDQAWMACRLGHSQATWSKADGVYSFRSDLKGGALPSDARIVFFHGKGDPWSREVYIRSPWIRDHYR